MNLLMLLGALSLLSGALFMAVAALGIWRMPDVYNRLSASAKAATLGVMLMLSGTALLMPGGRVLGLGLAITIFMLLTAPLSAHMIGRAAYWHGIPLAGDAEATGRPDSVSSRRL